MRRAWILLTASVFLACTSPSSEGETSTEATADSVETTVDSAETTADSAETGETGGLACGADVLTVAGQELAIVDFLGSSVGIGGGEFAQIAQLQLEGNVFLSLQFLDSTPLAEPVVISTEPDVTVGAYVINYSGFEGGPQDLCDRMGHNGASEGFFTLEQVVYGDDGFIDAICGELELHFTNCDFGELGISGDVVFMGSFRG